MYAILANLSVDQELDEMLRKFDTCNTFFYSTVYSFHLTLVSDITSTNASSLCLALESYFKPLVGTNVELLHPFVLAIDKFYLGLRWRMNDNIFNCIN